MDAASIAIIAGAFGSLVTACGAVFLRWLEKKHEVETSSSRERLRLTHDDESWTIRSQRKLFEELHEKYSALWNKYGALWTKVEAIQHDHHKCESALAEERSQRQESERKAAEEIANLKVRIRALEGYHDDRASNNP